MKTDLTPEMIEEAKKIMKPSGNARGKLLGWKRY